MRQKIRPVDVISLFDAQGKIQPLRIRLQDEEDCYRRIDVERILCTNEIRHAGAESQYFLCSATVEGVPWLFELKYALRSHSWSMVGRVY